MANLSISKAQIYYAARGRGGAPLLFLHGAGASHLLWNGQLAAFAADNRAIALDLPGHGRSTGTAYGTISGYARAVLEFLDVLELDRAVLIGSSMGGAIAQSLALDFPERARGLVLVGTGARLRVAPAFIEGVQTDFETTARALVEYYYTPDGSSLLRAKSLTQLHHSGPAVLAQDFAACDAFNVADRLSQILAPTLVICGSEDKMTPPKYSEYLAQHIPNAKLVLIPNAGHMVMLEQPRAVNRALRDWLGSFPD